MKARYCKRVGEALLLPAIVASLLSVCSLAHAQAWLPDRSYTEGPGVKAGEFEIHGGVAARAGWNSNVFFSDGDTSPRRGSALISVTPHINFSTRGNQRETEGEETKTAPPKIRLRSGADATVVHYTLDEAPPTNVEVGVNGVLQIMPERPVSGEVSANYSRTIRPFTENFDTDVDYVRNDVQVGGLLRFQSKGGVLSASAGYQPEFTLFDGKEFSYLNGYTHVVPLNMAWKFLPHTALLYDGEIRFQDFINSLDTTEAAVLYTDNNSFRSRLGLNGAITNHLALRVMVGAAFGFYEPVSIDGGPKQNYFDEYQEPLGQATLIWTFGGRAHKLQVGYEHDISASLVGAWIKRDRGNVTLSLVPASVVSLQFEVGGGQYRYGTMLNQQAEGLGRGGQTERKDLRLDAAVRAEYRVTHWLAFMADATLLLADTDFAYAVSGPGGSSDVIVDPASYTVFQVYGGVRAHY